MRDVRLTTRTRIIDSRSFAHDARLFLITLYASPPNRPLLDGNTWAPVARRLSDEI